LKKREAEKHIRKFKREVNFVNNKRVGFVIILLTLILSYIIVSGFITPKKYNIIVGELASETITAPKDIIDIITTEAIREQAEESVMPIYIEDDSIVPKMVKDFELFFAKLENAREYAEETYIKNENEKRKKNDKIEVFDKNPNEIDWSEVLSSSDKKIITSLASLDYAEGLAEKIASFTPEEINECEEKLTQIVQAETDDLSILNSDENYRNFVSGNLKLNYTFSEDILEIADIAVARYVFSYVSLDEEATEELILSAGESIEPFVYKKGQNIAVKGEIVTKEQFAVLKELGIANSRPVTSSLYLSLLGYMTLIFVGFYIFLAIFENEFFRNIKNSLMLGIIIIIVVLTASLTERFQPDLILVLFGTMMCAVLIYPRLAITYNAFFALVFSGIMIWNNGSITPVVFEKVLLIIISGSVCAGILKNIARRSSLLLAGFLAGFTGSLIILSFGFLMNVDIFNIALDSIWYIASCILCGVIALGFLPLWEIAFNIATPTRLLELSNTHKSLLKRLLHEAPGTYYHSLMVSNLSESAANAIGANSLLVSAAALYHDIGKLDRPDYFTENQSGEDPHEEHTLKESADILIGHVASSIKIAKTNRIPSEVIKIMSEHHGDSLLQNFYFKEKKSNPKVEEKEFRYPFSKPTTKESAILMLADTVEAAMRSQRDLSIDKKREKITSLIVEKFNHGLLDDSPLTRKDLGVLANIFTVSLENAHHNRIKYSYNLSGKSIK